MSKSQPVEWKESWRDDYLKCVAGFVDPHGSVLIQINVYDNHIHF